MFWKALMQVPVVRVIEFTLHHKPHPVPMLSQINILFDEGAPSQPHSTFHCSTVQCFD